MSANYERDKEAIARYHKSPRGRAARKRAWLKYMQKPWVRCQKRVLDKVSAGRRGGSYRGITSDLTIAQLKMMWDRDGASKMKRPSIDRLDGAGHYTVDNCRFIELNENQRRKKAKRCCITARCIKKM